MSLSFLRKRSPRRSRGQADSVENRAEGSSTNLRLSIAEAEEERPYGIAEWVVGENPNIEYIEIVANSDVR
jgi:hypothetical protein